MQLCNNGDVRQYMEKRGIKFFKEKEAVYFLKQIAMGFRELQLHKVMHRDFKIDNLFIHNATVVIADFGLAIKDKEMTNECCGTLQYMAPEILKHKSYSNLGDLWAIGVAFYEMLFDRFPFEGVEDMEVLANININSGMNLIIPKDVNDISSICIDFLQKIFEPDPEKRMTWEKFFKHSVFKSNQDSVVIGQDNPLGSTLDADNLFDSYIEILP